MTTLESRALRHNPRTHYRPSDDGYRATCSCGWTGGLYARRSQADAESQQHVDGATS